MSDTQLLIAAVYETPADVTAVGMLYDAMQEAGISPLAAKRRANKIARAAKAFADLADAQALVAGAAGKSAKLRTRIRAACGCGSNTAAEITVIAGDAAPIRTGEPAYHTFRNGGVCNYPGSAIRAGYKIDYHPSTVAVSVGAGWVLRSK